MNEKHVNMVLKIGMVFIGIAFLVIYFFHSQNGRFHMQGNGSNFVKIMDTRTGTLYACGGVGGIEVCRSIDPIKASVR